MTKEQDAFLNYSAGRYIWWKTVAEAKEYPQMILAQVMNIGVWDDMCELVRLFSESELRNVLVNAEIGQLNERSWHFWHNRLSNEIPPMPQRILS